MRRLEGRSLAEILIGQREGVQEDLDNHSRIRLLSAFVQICMAVEFAHSRRVVHRDLKPGNIMLGEFGEVQLIDWGIARRIDEEDAKDIYGESLTGTPSYMAPEQIKMEGGMAPQLSDVYSLGAILYEVLTLRRLFEDPDPERP